MSASEAKPRRSLRNRILVRGTAGVLLAVTVLAVLLGISANMRRKLAAAVDAFVEEQLIADRISQAVMRQFLLVSSVRGSPADERPEGFRAPGDVVYDQLRLYLLRDLTPEERIQLETIKEEHERLEVAAARAADRFARGDVAAGEGFIEVMSSHGGALLDALDGFLRMREADLQDLRRTQRKAFRTMYGVGGVFGAVLLVGSVALVRFLLRSVDAPLAALSAAARRIERGELHVRVRDAYDEEFATVAASFNRMAASLEQALAAARRSEEGFRHLFTSNPLPMWVYDLETLGFLEVNDAAVTHYGYMRDEFLAMGITDIRPAEDVSRLLADVAKERGELSHAGEWRHRLKDGRIIDVDITSHLLEFSGRPAALVVARDITERNQMEAEIRSLNEELEQRVADRTAALEASEEQFRTLATTAHDAIIAADDEGWITYFNPGAERTFGYAATEVVGRPLTVLMPERFHGPHQQGLARYVATGEARVVGRTVELVGRRKDGAEFPIELSLASRQPDGAPEFIGIIRDITQRKETERELQRYAAELEAANKELEAFSYSVSHDLRAPLRSIHGFSQAVLEDYEEHLDAQGIDYLRRVCAGAERMGTLIDDLLELSRATRTEMERQQVDLSQLGERIARDVAAANPDRHVDFRIARGLTCEGDQELLTLVLRNLLENAWKFTAKEDGAVIEIGVTDDEKRAFFVRDNGAGFDASYADKLFQPFQRLHSPRDFAGTGIGLALVQRIIHRHGGRVWAAGAVERGATFYFTVPDA